jgi:hypothetical protein
MASMPIKDGNGATKYMNVTGVGTSGDPYTPVHGLPSGAATAANQSTANTHLSNIASGVDINSGQEVAIADDETMLFHQGVTSGSGVTALISAPGAGTRIVVSGFRLQQEDANGTLCQLRDDTTDEMRWMGVSQGDKVDVQFPVGREWKLTENKALNLYLSDYDAVAIGYSIYYYTESTS